MPALSVKNQGKLNLNYNIIVFITNFMSLLITTEQINMPLYKDHNNKNNYCWNQNQSR